MNRIEKQILSMKNNVKESQIRQDSPGKQFSLMELEIKKLSGQITKCFANCKKWHLKQIVNMNKGSV